jgi:WD40 repeat protein
VFIMAREKSFDVFRLESQSHKKEALPVLVPEEKLLLGTVEIKSASNIACSAISDSGAYVAVADASSLMLFQLSFDGEEMRPERLPLELPDRLSSLQVHAMCFAPDNKSLLFASSDGRIHVAGLGDDDKVQSIDTGGHESLVSAMCTNNDGSFFLTFRDGLHGSQVEVFRQDRDGSYRHWWKVPPLEMPVTAARFLGATELAVSCVNFAVYVFDLEKRSLGSWSNSLGVSVSQSLPNELLNRKDFPVRLCNNPASPNKFFVVSIVYCVEMFAQTLFQYASLVGVLGLSSLRDLSESSFAQSN